MEITFCGAARTVTGSKHLLTLDNGEKILLDCGMFQGMGAQTNALNADFGFNPHEIGCVLLSHAHIDHSGLLPKLIKEGFTGKIYSTMATAELTEILLHDSAEIQDYDAQDEETLYDHADVMETARAFQIIEYDKPFSPIAGVTATLFNNGHLPGSAAIFLEIEEDDGMVSLLYSGDVGKTRSTLLMPPTDVPQADYIIMESTYGDSHHAAAFNNVEEMRKWVEDTCVVKKGKLIIPAFSVGRTQEVLYILNQLSLENLLPEVNVYVDSPLGMKATETIKKYPFLFNDRLQSVLEIDDDPFEFEGLKYVETAELSRQLKESDEPCVIIASSGTADAGRVRHHIFECITDKKNTILFSGYCGWDSLGGQLLRGEKEVNIFGKARDVYARIDKLKGLSAHGDSDDLLKFLDGQDVSLVKNLFLVHGEYEVQQSFKTILQAKGFGQIAIPAGYEKFVLGT